MEDAGGGTMTADRSTPPDVGEPPRGGFEVYPEMRTVPAPDEPGGYTTREEPTGEYGWRYRSANGQITATGGEGFTREEDAERAIRYFSADVTKGHATLTIKRVED